MAYYRRSSPATNRLSGIIMVIIAVIAAIIGTVKHIKSNKLKAQCSASTPGVIIDVDDKIVHSRRSRHTEYQALVMYVPAGEKEKTLTTRWTSARLTEGTATTVYYDPNDPDTAYASAVPPDDGVPAYIFAGTFALVGIILWLTNRGK